MLTKNNTSSDLTRKRQTRMQFANYIIQQQAVANGCLGRITIEGGSGGDKMASIFTDIKDGQRFTTEAERDRILLSDRCPPSSSSGGGSGPTPPDPTGSTGENVWGVSFYSTTGSTTPGVLPYASAIDTNGNIYIAGTYNNDKFTVNSYSSTNSSTKVISQTIFGQLPTTTTTASFITKHNSSGAAQWATSVTATTSCACYDVAADSNGNVYSLHQFTGTATVNSYTSRVDGGDITLTAYGTVASAGNADVLIVKHNSSGEVQWVAQIKGTGAEVLQRQFSKNIAIDSNTNICFTIEGGTSGGNLTTFSNFSSGGGGGSITFSTFGTYAGKSRGIYICKINSSGVFQWVSEVRPIATFFSAIFSACSVDSNNNVYIVFNCYTDSSSDGFDLQSYDGLSGTTILTTLWASVTSLLGDRDGFVAKLNSDGVFQQCARIGTANVRVTDEVSITIDSNNNILAAFKYSSGVSYNDDTKINIYSAGGKDSSDNVVFTAWASLPVRGVTASSGSDTAILLFNSNLVAQSATYFYNADIVSPGRNCKIYSIDRDSNNNIYVNVYYNSTLTINSFTSVGTGGLNNNINVTTFATLANSGLSGFDCALVKFTSSLVTEWATRINDVLSTATLVPHTISVDRTSGSVYTAGYFDARDTGGVRFQNYTAVSGGAVTLTLGGQINSAATGATSIRQGYLAKY